MSKPDVQNWEQRGYDSKGVIYHISRSKGWDWSTKCVKRRIIGRSIGKAGWN